MQGAGTQDRLRHLVVAVDGPSGSGKSTTARGVARQLGLRYLDTGALYRALTWAMLRDGIDVTDPGAVGEHAEHPVLRAGTDPDAPTISVDGTDVSGPIREAAVTSAVSSVSAVSAVRQILLRMQRSLIGQGGIVVEGRDIGSVVAPGADVKVFLTADPSERARRRHAELAAASTNSANPANSATVAPPANGAGWGAALLDQTRDDLARRDKLDSSRTVSPLTQAADAVVLDTTELGVAEAVARVCALAKARIAAQADPGVADETAGP